jgi:hypothetical protein
MGKNPRTLSKSRFKTGWECPTKLYFTGKPEYGNTNLDNAFLKALAEGGFQVAGVVKLYHPGGQEIETLATTEAVQQTQVLLEKDKFILSETALQTGDPLVRVDVLTISRDLDALSASGFESSNQGATVRINCFTRSRNANLLNQGFYGASAEFI